MLGGIYLHTQSLELIQESALPGLSTSSRELGIRPSPSLLEMLRAWLLRSRKRAGWGSEGALAFLESLPPGGGFSELPRITRWFERSGIPSLHGDPRSLALRRGGGAQPLGRVTLRGRPVSFAYRDFSFEDVGGPDNRRLRLLARLWEEERVTPGFPSDFDQKGILECLSSEQFFPLFTREEVLRFRAHVPWTRVLMERKTRTSSGRTVDLVDYALKNRETLVLKPSWESGGEGILIGPKTLPSRWEKAIQAGLKMPGGWAVQQYLDIPRKKTAYLRDGVLHFKECRHTIGVFYDGERFGFHARVSPRDIVNVARGGALCAVYLA